MLRNLPVTSTLKATPLIALLMALLLNLSIMSMALAGSAIVNGDFGTGLPGINGPTCELTGWTTKGAVSVVNGSNERLYRADNCVAKIYADRDYSSLEQTFQVPSGPTADQYIVFYIWSNSSRGYRSNATPPEGAYLPQTVTLYDDRGNVIYSKSRNVSTSQTERGQFKYDLSAYAGMNVRLEVKVSIDPNDPSSPSWASLYVDKVTTSSYTMLPGDGNYNW